MPRQQYNFFLKATLDKKILTLLFSKKKIIIKLILFLFLFLFWKNSHSFSLYALVCECLFILIFFFSSFFLPDFFFFFLPALSLSLSPSTFFSSFLSISLSFLLSLLLPDLSLFFRLTSFFFLLLDLFLSSYFFLLPNLISQTLYLSNQCQSSYKLVGLSLVGLSLRSVGSWITIGLFSSETLAPYLSSFSLVK